MQAGSGEILATSCVRSSIETPFGTIPESQIHVTKLQNNDLIVGTDLLDHTDIMLKVELLAHGYSLDDLESIRRRKEESNAINSEPKGFVYKLPEEKPFTDEYAARLQQMLIAEFPSVFKTKLPDSLRPIKEGDVVHVIELIHPEAEKKSRGFYPIPNKMFKRAKALIDDHVRTGRLVLSNVPVAAPIFFKDKKQGSTVPPRLLCDYRARNRNTIKDATSVPNMAQILQMAKGKYYAVFDLTDAFGQIRMHPKSQKFTAINTPFVVIYTS